MIKYKQTLMKENILKNVNSCKIFCTFAAKLFSQDIH